MYKLPPLDTVILASAVPVWLTCFPIVNVPVPLTPLSISTVPFISFVPSPIKNLVAPDAFFNATVPVPAWK